MVNLANKRGGRDNVSVIVIRAEATEETLYELNTQQHATTDYDDEETIALPGGFGPMESAAAPPSDQRDGSPQMRREPPGTFSTTQTTPAVKLNGKHDSDDEDNGQSNPDMTDTLGEGTDPYRPDQ